MELSLTGFSTWIWANYIINVGTEQSKATELARRVKFCRIREIFLQKDKHLNFSYYSQLQVRGTVTEELSARNIPVNLGNWWHLTDEELISVTDQSLKLMRFDKN